MSLTKFEVPPGCDCNTCRSMCSCPGLLTPLEALELMAQGLANQLMERDCRMNMGLSPAIPSYKGKRAPYYIRGHGEACVFQKDGLCSLYNNPGRPSECRLAHCSTPKNSIPVMDAVQDLWNTEDGQQVMEWWDEAVRA